MADRKISEHTALAGTVLATGDLEEVVDISDTTDAASGTNKKLTSLEKAVAYDRLHATDPLTRYLKPTGSYETFSRTTPLTSQTPLTSGAVSLFAIGLPKDLLVTNITFVSGTTAAGTPTNYWFALCDSTYVTLRSTADQLTAAWAANTVKTLALSSTFTTLYEGLYYLAIMLTGGTVPSLFAQAISASNNVVNAIAPLVAVNGITGQTAAKADGTNLSTSPAAKTLNVWAYVT